MKTIRSFLPYLLLYGLLFYLLPRYTASVYLREEVPAAVVVLAVIALFCGFGGVLFGARHGHPLVFGLFVGLLFFPCAFLYYRQSALTYNLGFALLGVAGNVFGCLLHKFGMQA